MARSPENPSSWRGGARQSETFIGPATSRFISAYGLSPFRVAIELIIRFTPAPRWSKEIGQLGLPDDTAIELLDVLTQDYEARG